MDEGLLVLLCTRQTRIQFHVHLPNLAPTLHTMLRQPAISSDFQHCIAEGTVTRL